MTKLETKRFASGFAVLAAAVMIGPAVATAGQVLDERVATKPKPAAAAQSAQAGVASGGAEAAEAAQAAAPVLPAFEGLLLKEGHRLSTQLQEWLQTRGWQLRWDLSTDWVIPGEVRLDSPDVLQVVDQLARWLTRQGAEAQFVAYERNRIIEARSLQARKAD